MTPLQKVAMGLVLTLADPEIAGYDAVPDVLGWVLVVLGLRGLGGRVALSTLMPLALLSGVVSLGLIRFDWLEVLPESTGWLLSLPQLAFSWVLCGEAAAVVGPDLARRFRGLRWAFLVAAVGPVLLYGGGVDVLLVPLAVIAVAANLYLVYLLFRASTEVHDARPGRPRS
ncbi:MAG TPA: hypothetical protein VFZ64_12490 [Nocardioidaceae bacterium]